MMPAVGHDALADDIRTIRVAHSLAGPKPPTNCLARLIKSSYALSLLTLTPMAAAQPLITPPKTERNAAIYAAYLTEQLTMAEIAAEFGIGQQRAQQIIARERKRRATLTGLIR